MKQKFFLFILVILSVIISFVDLSLSNIFFHKPVFMGLISFVFFLFISVVFFKYKNFLIKKKDKILIGLLIMSPQLKALSIGFLDILDIFIVFFLFLYLIDIIRNERPIMHFSTFHFFLICIFLTATISVINGGLPSLILLLRIGKSVFYFFLLCSLLCKKERFIWAVKALFCTLGISAIISILQEIIFLTSGFVLVGNVSNKNISLMFELTSFGLILRSPAFFGVPQDFANLLSFSIPILFLLTFFDKSFNLNKTLMQAILFLLLIALFLTYSRGAWIGTMAGTLCGLILIKRKYLFHIITICLVILILAISTNIIEEFTNMVSNQMLFGDLRDRIFLARDSFQRIKNHLFIGRGLGMGERYTASVMGWPVHNGFALSFVETGGLGFFIFLSFFTFLIGKLIFYCFSFSPARQIFFIAFLSGIVGYIIDIQFDPFFITPRFWIIMGILSFVVENKT